ncbi:uncharacterized protein [Amphiura filiformis]|uniref:uncharacterized protein n=1 Tax=Amphiura filiformis TaxID=82378 RepID=UPI003B20DCCC
MASFAILLLLYVGSVSASHSLWDCESLLPVNYERPPETSLPPYRIDVYPNNFQPGSVVQVELRANANSTFNGFRLQARRADIGYGSQDEPVGEFEVILPPFDTELRDCGSGTKNVWTHNNTDVNVDKYTRIIRWVAPSTFEGPIVFRATVTQGDVYWTNVESVQLNSLSDLMCYDCYYTETNGVPDPNRDNKDTCHYFPLAARVVNCADELSLQEGSVYRCYTSEWKNTNSAGDVVLGIRRGCIEVDAGEYGFTASTSDIDDIEEIFDFEVAPDEQQTGSADFCYSPRCNNEVSELQCYECDYMETNGVPEFQYDPNKYNCFYDPHLVDFESCGPIPAGYIHRCYTSVYRKTTRYGDYVQGIRRGCVAVNAARFGSLLSTSNIEDIEEIFDFELLPGDEQKGTADMCVSDFCNDVPAELMCYDCSYTETNGVTDPNRDDKDSCYYYPWRLDVVNCEEEEGPLGIGEIYRCYTSQYYKRTAYGDIEEGIRRGCVAVRRSYYGTLYTTSDIEVVEDIFDFTLPDGDVQTGTSSFCDIDSCNDDDAGLQCYNCYYSETNGALDSYATDSKQICQDFPSTASLVNCVDDAPLQAGQIHRCYTSEWDRRDANGDVRTGIRRGCVAVDDTRFGDIPWTTNIDYIQEIFNFQLGPGDRQTGTSDFCDWDECNNEYLFAPVWNSWGPYSEFCSRTCGGGTQTRYRTCNDPRPGDDFYCIGPSSESIQCNNEPCPTDDAYWSTWSSWTLCSATCGSDGTLTRTRLCVDPLAFINSGRCDGDESEMRSCSAPPCPFQEWSRWSSWGGCSELCGGGERGRSRYCYDAQIPNRCDGRSTEYENCNVRNCDDDERGINTLVLVGIILALVAGIIIAVLLTVCCCLGFLRAPRIAARPRPWYSRSIYYFRR